MVKLVCLAVCIVVTFVEASPNVSLGGVLAGDLSLGSQGATSGGATSGGTTSGGSTSAQPTCSRADIDPDTKLFTSLTRFQRVVFFFHSVDENFVALVGSFQKGVIECYAIQNGNLTGTLTVCRGGNATQAELTFAESNGAFVIYNFPASPYPVDLLDYDCGDENVLTKICVRPASGPVTNAYAVTSRNSNVPADKIKKCEERAKDPAIKWVKLDPKISCGCGS